MAEPKILPDSRIPRPLEPRPVPEEVVPAEVDLSGKMPDILPDSRARDTKKRIFTQLGVWVPVYCANCGADGGACPEENMTFIFYICRKCADTYGPIANTMWMPDEVFFEKLKQEQMSAFGRYLTQDELTKVVEEDASPLATLLKTGH